MKVTYLAAIFAALVSLNVASAWADNSACGAEEAKQSNDCGRESEELLKGCKGSQSQAQMSNDKLAGQVGDTSGLGEYRKGKMLASIASAGKQNFDAANSDCGQRRQKLAKACGCAHSRALKREQDARSKYENAKNLKEKRKWRDKMVEAARDRARARGYDRDRGGEIDADRRRLTGYSETLGDAARRSAISSAAASGSGENI